VLLHEQHVRARRCIAMRCTQWPTSAWDRDLLGRSPRLIGRHGLPPSSCGTTPAAEIAMKIRAACSDRAGSCAGTCRPRPAASTDADVCVRSPGSSLPRLAAVGRAEQRGVLDPA
jgi:hypothetical protein